MADALHVFVSSTSLDLGPERAEVEKVLDGFAETKFVGMEHFGSRDESTGQASLDEVDRSRLYIGIFGGRWGSGITHDEYRRARAGGLHCLIYFKSEAAIDAACAAGEGARDGDEAARAKRGAFLEELKRHHIVRASFDRAEQLAVHVALDVHRWLFDVARPRATAGRAPLHDHVVDFRDLIASQTAGFEGRAELFELLERFAEEPSGGYVALTADAGLGKTAFAAEVARRWNTPAWFCSVAENRTAARTALEHLCAELALRWELPHDHLPPRAGEDGTFFAKLLAQAAAKATAAGATLWLVVDALDETDPLGAGRNPLLLPPELPPGTCVLLTMRPESARLMTRPGTRWLSHTLRADDAMQQQDLRAWLRGAFRRPRIAAACAAAKPAVGEVEFVERLGAVAAGNFKYLTYVVADIGEHAPGYAPLDLERLPSGLEGYYAQFWARMGLDDLPTRDWPTWDSIVRPVLELLGAAAEPVTAEWFGDFVGVAARQVLDRVLRPWRRFLAEAAGGRWSIVHKSFADFLAARPELDVRGAHARIARHLRVHPASWSAHGGYALRHLAVHLRRAGDAPGLDALIDDPAWSAAQEAVDPSGSGFLDDVAQAWVLHAQADRDAFAEGREPPSLAAEVRCAMISATLRQRSANHPPGLLAELVRQGHWSAATALAVVDQMPVRGDRDAALEALAPVLDAGNVRRALDRTPSGTARRALWCRLAELGGSEEALAGALADDLPALAALFPCLVEPAQRERAARAALARAASAQAAIDERDRREGVRTFGVDAHIGHLQRLLDAAPGALLDAMQADPAGGPLRSALPAMLDRGRAFDDARHGRADAALARVIDRARSDPDCADWVRGLVDVLSPVDPVAAESFAKQALEALLPSQGTWLSARGVAAFGDVAERSGASAVERLADRLLPVIAQAFSRVGCLGAAARWWPATRLDAAIEVVEAIADREDRRDGRAAFAPAVLRHRGWNAALRWAERDGDSYDRSVAINALVPLIAQAGHPDAALASIEALPRDSFVPGALAAVAPHLPSESIERARSIAERIANPERWARAAGALAQRLATLGRPEQALALLHRLHDDDGSPERLQGGVAWMLARAGETVAALETASAIHKGDVRLRTLADLAKVMPAAGLPALWTALVQPWQDEVARANSGAWYDAQRGLADALAGLTKAFGSPATRPHLDAVPPGLMRGRLLLQLSASTTGPHADALQAEGLAEIFRDPDDWWSACAVLEDAAGALNRPALRAALRWIVSQRRTLRRDAGPHYRHDELDRADTALLLRRVALGGWRWIGNVVPRIGSTEAQLPLMAALVPRLRQPARRKLVDAMVAVVADAHYEQAELMRKVAPVLDAETWSTAVDILPSIRDDRTRMASTRVLVARALEFEDMEVVASTVQSWRDGAMRDGGVAALAPRATGEMLPGLAQARSGRAREQYRPDPGVEIAARWAELGGQVEALAMARETREEEAFAAIAPWLDAAGIEQARADVGALYASPAARSALALREARLGSVAAALDHVFTGLDDDGDTPHRSRALSSIVDAITGAPRPVVGAAWQQVLRAAAAWPRPQAIETVRRLLPLAGCLAPERRLVDQAAVVAAVVRRWP